MTFSRKAQIAVAATDMVAILVAAMLAAQMRLGMCMDLEWKPTTR